MESTAHQGAALLLLRDDGGLWHGGDSRGAERLGSGQKGREDVSLRVMCERKGETKED